MISFHARKVFLRILFFRYESTEIETMFESLYLGFYSEYKTGFYYKYS